MKLIRRRRSKAPTNNTMLVQIDITNCGIDMKQKKDFIESLKKLNRIKIKKVKNLSRGVLTITIIYTNDAWQSNRIYYVKTYLQDLLDQYKFNCIFKDLKTKNTVSHLAKTNIYRVYYTETVTEVRWIEFKANSEEDAEEMMSNGDAWDYEICSDWADSYDSEFKEITDIELIE